MTQTFTLRLLNSVLGTSLSMRFPKSRWTSTTEESLPISIFPMAASMMCPDLMMKSASATFPAPSAFPMSMPNFTMPNGSESWS